MATGHRKEQSANTQGPHAGKVGALFRKALQFIGIVIIIT